MKRTDDWESPAVAAIADDAGIRRYTHCPACHGTALTVAFTSAAWRDFAATTADTRRTVAATLNADMDLGFDAFLRCDGCGTVFTDRVPPPTALSRFYQAYYGNAGYLSKRDRKVALETRRIFLLKFLIRGRRFLDVGCNMGCAVEAARRNGFTATGLELDETSVAMAREQFSRNEFIAGTIDGIPPQQRFDLLYCSEVIEHVPDVPRFAAKLGGLVAPGGMLFLTTPDSGHKKLRGDVLRWDVTRPPEHLTLFTRAGIRAALAPYFARVLILPNAKPGVQAIAFKGKN